MSTAIALFSDLALTCWLGKLAVQDWGHDNDWLVIAATIFFAVIACLNVRNLARRAK